MRLARHDGAWTPLFALWRRAVEATHDFVLPADLDFYESVLYNALPRLEVWTAKSQEGLLGFMALDRHMVEMLFIDPPFHRRGVGQALLNTARQLKGALQVYVNQQNLAALNFYLQYGFRETERLPLDGSGKAYPLVKLALTA